MLIDLDRGTRSDAKTDGSGGYLFRSLFPGSYSIKAEITGFQPYELTGITIDVNSSLTADLNLRLLAAKESVVVVSRAPLLETQDSTVSQTLTAS